MCQWRYKVRVKLKECVIHSWGFKCNTVCAIVSQVTGLSKQNGNCICNKQQDLCITAVSCHVKQKRKDTGVRWDMQVRRSEQKRRGEKEKRCPMTQFAVMLSMKQSRQSAWHKQSQTQQLKPCRQVKHLSPAIGNQTDMQTRHRAKMSERVCQEQTCWQCCFRQIPWYGDAQHRILWKDKACPLHVHKELGSMHIEVASLAGYYWYWLWYVYYWLLFVSFWIF